MAEAPEPTDTLTSEALDLFTIPRRDNRVLDGWDEVFQPLVVSEDGPFEFNIAPLSEDIYLKLNSMRLLGDLTISNMDGTDLADDAVIAIINNGAPSLWSRVDFKIAGKDVAHISTSHHAYKAFLDTIVGYGKDSQLTHLETNIYYPDTEEQAATCGVANASFRTRMALSAGSRTFSFSMPMIADFLQTTRLLIGTLGLRIKLTRNTDAFCIVRTGGVDVKLRIKNLRLEARRLSIRQDVVDKHMALWKTTNLAFPFAMTEIRTINVPVGEHAIIAPMVFDGRLPKHIVIAFVRADAYHGLQTRNPLCFLNMGINRTQISVNGKLIPQSAYQPDFARGDVMREYRAMFDNFGINREDHSFMITSKSYIADFPLSAYDGSSCLCLDHCNHLSKRGIVKYEATFSTPTTFPTVLMAFGVKDELVEISYDHQIFANTAE